MSRLDDIARAYEFGTGNIVVSKQEVKNLMLELIGENEEDDLNPFGMMARSTAQNYLREELREKVNKL